MAITGTAGQTQDFGYRGSVQSYKIPADGVYKLEVWGAGGGNFGIPYGDYIMGDGGAGGYSVGYRVFRAGEVIYVCVGGAGAGNWDGYLGGSFNGGGAPGSGGGTTIYGGASGGGATHIAGMTGTLEAIGAANIEKIFIVAGGGGGGGHTNVPTIGAHAGGAGGGSAGGTAGGTDGGEGGSQNSGGSGANAGTFGKGGDGAKPSTLGDGGGSGGGGGLYGGGGYNAGGGGSGYIGGVPRFSLNGVTYPPSTAQGGGCAVQSNGRARLTYMAPAYIPVYYDETHLQGIVFNGTKLDHLIYNGQAIYCGRIASGMRKKIGLMRKGGARPCLT